jgi:hypothetical protein
MVKTSRIAISQTDQPNLATHKQESCAIEKSVPQPNPGWQAGPTKRKVWRKDKSFRNVPARQVRQQVPKCGSRSLFRLAGARLNSIDLAHYRFFVIKDSQVLTLQFRLQGDLI